MSTKKPSIENDAPHSSVEAAAEPPPDWELQDIVIRYAAQPAHLAIMLALHIECGTVHFTSLREKYGMKQAFLDATLGPMRTAGLIRYDGRTISKVDK